MSQLHQYHEGNTKGRDFVVGDIHGCFHMLEQALAAICFDPERDRLFSVGDLIDRGPLSHLVLEWLEKPWFHAVRGNHEQMLLDYVDGQIDSYMYSINGGQWLISLPGDQQALYRTRIAELPVAITVETANGPVGIVHAECRRDNWMQMISEIDDDPHLLQACLWSLTKISDGNTSIIEGVRHVFVGHTPLDEPVTLGNTIFIDTGAFRPTGALTIFDIDGDRAVTTGNRFWSA